MNIRIKHISILFLFAFGLLLSSCGDKKAGKSNSKVEFAPKPQWVDQRPFNNAFYIGVGSCSKTAQPMDYQNIAKKNALNDLASEISVKVQGSTFLNTLEVNKAFSEEFISNISTTTNEQIEDFEVAGVWENETEYWVYYRLNKAQFQSAKQQKKNLAMSAANDYYIKGLEAEAQGNVPSAIDLYLHGLFAMKNYWNEVNEFYSDSSKIFIDNNIYSSLQRVANGLQIDPGTNKIVLGAENSYTYNAVVRLTYNGKPVKGITVTHSFTKSKYTKPKSQVTDGTGSISTLIADVSTTDKNPAFNIRLDLENLQPTDLDRNITSGIIKNLRTEGKQVPIEILMPTFFISSDEKALGKPANSTVLASGMQTSLVNQGMRIAQSAKTANYTINIIGNTIDGGTSQGFTVSFLEMSVIVLSANGETVYSESINNIKGLQLNLESASQDAYKKGRSRIEEQMVSSILEVIF